MFRKKTGQQGEDLAARHLKEKGYRILERSVHAGRMGELDIVATKEGVLVFVEVKSRRNARFGLPEEAVSAKKLTKLVKAIHWYRQVRRLECCPYRLDVIAIEWRQSEHHIRHLRSVDVS